MLYISARMSLSETVSPSPETATAISLSSRGPGKARRSRSFYAGRTAPARRSDVLPCESADHEEDEVHPGGGLRGPAARACGRRLAGTGGIQPDGPPVRQGRAPRRLSLSVPGLLQALPRRGEIRLPYAALVGPPHRVRADPGRRTSRAVQEEPHESVRERGGPGPRALPGQHPLGVEARRGLYDGPHLGAQERVAGAARPPLLRQAGTLRALRP